MQPESVLKAEQETESPNPNSEQESSPANGYAPPTANTDKAAAAAAPQNGSAAGAGQFPPPKTDKPRPHVCGTCGRSFARLEHLKRHERSHTKEKPFECPECTRCFARRDLLLRHQQKLHMTNTTSSRPRSGRRESMSGAPVGGTSRVRKSSVVNANVSGPTAGHRPRANTISHVDLAGLGLMDNVNPGMNRLSALGIHSGQNLGMHGLGMTFDYRGMSTTMGQHGNLQNLPKLDMQSVSNLDMSNSLRTAPPMAGLGASAGFDLDQLFSPGTTVNPAQLHFGGGAPLSATQQFPNYEGFTSQHPMIPEGEDFGWMRNWNIQFNSTQDNNEQAIDESSPSRMSSGDSPGDYSESLQNSTPALPQVSSNFQWSQPDPANQDVQNGPFQLNSLGSGLPNLDQGQVTLSPSALQDHTPTPDVYFHQAMMQHTTQHQQQQQQPQHLHQPQLPNQQPLSVQPSQTEFNQGQATNFFAPSLSNFSSNSPSMSSSSMAGSGRQSSVTSGSTDSITDATRQALLSSLSQPSVFGHNHRKYSQPSVSSPLSPGSANGRGHSVGPNLPNTADIRRFVDAFIQHAHPHLPVTHIPTLSFEAAEYTTNLTSKSSMMASNAIHGGGGCLILAMAAIGALYEYEHTASKELFEAGKKMISLYLEERRKADISATVNGSASSDPSARDTPLWLVQAMFLNVIYGHQCGDRTAADIASNHCAALVSLARAADLAQPPSSVSPVDSGHPGKDDVDVEMNETYGTGHMAGAHGETDLHQQWLDWIVVEKRKRTLYAIFILSSLLTTAYNQTPTIMNSEILLELPCDEDLWSAESAQEWQNRGGMAAIEANSISFAAALSTLLTANQRHQNHFMQTFNSNSPLGSLRAGDHMVDFEMRPSTFGCLVLINALHNYIWETRSRHHGRQWTVQETESMFSHIEPALNAWQAAWKANEHHRLERPNPFGLGPLSADSIPLLDLAFVRLFVNLGRSKEAFWARDFDTMADELARGTEIVQHAEPAPMGEEQEQNKKPSPVQTGQRRASQAPAHDRSSSRRERHLRKAAFYAADSLTIACSYNLTYADMTAHELPIQSAMCFFDCSQVLAEWACTVQERVGRYLGVLGRDSIDWSQVPAIMLLEAEDIELLKKIERITESLESKRLQQENLLTMDMATVNGMNMSNNISLASCGYGSKVLRAVSNMLERAVVWPVTHVHATALEAQASHMDQRAEASCVQ